MKRSEKRKDPVMTTTDYDRASSFLMAVVSGLSILVFVLVLQLQTREPVKSEPIKPDWNLVGGSPDNNSPKLAGVVSPEDQPEYFPNATFDVNFEDLFHENEVGLFSAEAQASSLKGDEGGSGNGTGPIGDPPGKGTGEGDRWFITYGDKDSLETYARQLDFFGIEIAYYDFDTKNLTYVSNFNQEKPTSRVVKPGKDKRHAFLWQGKGRSDADVQLLKKAGIEVNNGVIVHFYPNATEIILADAEKRKSNRPTKDIRRTYFVIRPDGAGFQFVVTRISYKK